MAGFVRMVQLCGRDAGGEERGLGLSWRRGLRKMPWELTAVNTVELQLMVVMVVVKWVAEVVDMWLSLAACTDHLDTLQGPSQWSYPTYVHLISNWDSPIQSI